jgi:hypothetical protein
MIDSSPLRAGLMVLIVFGTLGILKVNLDLVRHLLIHVLAAKTGNDSYNTKAQGSPCNTPINLLAFSSPYRSFRFLGTY